MPLKVREIIRLLQQNGWVEMRSKGSYRHSNIPNTSSSSPSPARTGRSSPRHAQRYTQIGRAKMKRYPVVIEPTSTGFSAYSPDVPGCVAVGDTEDETRLNFRDALAEHFQAMREIGAPIPEPHTSVDYVHVAE